MIVRDETAVLGRLFESVRDYIDYYVIVDTGSRDGTQEFIRRWMDAAGIEGEVHERRWVNFGHNRQQALELALAAGRGDWLLIIDADEELGVSDSSFCEKMQAGVTYRIEKHHGGERYAVPHLLDIRHNRWRWAGPVHNYLQHLDGPQRSELRKDVWIVYHPEQGAKSHGLTAKEKYLRDAKILMKELRKNPQDTRSQFYLARSYHHAGHFEEAWLEYRKRAEMEGFEEEKFIAQFEVGRMAIRLGRSENTVLQELLKAYDIRPWRAEPLHELAAFFRERKKYGRAFVFARTGSLLPRPDDALFVSEDVYAWKLLDELAVAAYWIGQFDQSRACCEEILARNKEGVAIPEAELIRVQQNLAFANLKQGNLAE